MSTHEVRRRAAPHFIDRATVIGAALQVFAESGFHGASMRGIAAVAETSQSNLYNYFDSKVALLRFVLETTSRELADALEAGDADGEGEPSARLVRAVEGYVHFVTANPNASTAGITEVRYLEGEDRSSVVAERDRAEAVFRRIVEAGVEAGEFDVADIGFATRAVVTLCNSMSGWYRADGPLGPSEIARLQADMALGLVRSRSRCAAEGDVG
ncbi:TetR/AcrR family transcriptional regulator [Brevibacterium album]|uniref:TetR/AcrR family transcriptional regulator n=1 Tax=Brevibacterium album TaxID=417948 RepID=UPI0004076E0A|nr:TetR/AcrR family transcriptional regulator [Brevibacterium album]